MEEEKALSKANRELKRLRCIPQDMWIGGVCSGIAYRLGLSVWVVRMIWALTVLCYGFGVGLYILLWIFVPNAKELPADYHQRTGDEDDSV